MRKLTYTQAATCGENLKARVTAEQSEKMQLAWFAAGKTWQGGDKSVTAYDDMRFMFLTDVLVHCSSYDRDCFVIDCNDEEIELIDDLPQPDFASQQEVWAWLVSGNRVKNNDGNIVGFKDGKLFCFISNANCIFRFENSGYWQKHTSPRLIRVNGIEVPAPLESLEGVNSYWTPVIHKVFNCEKAVELKKLSGWYKSDYDLLAAGLCYANKEDAIKRAEAMIKFEVVE